MHCSLMFPFHVKQVYRTRVKWVRRKLKCQLFLCVSHSAINCRCWCCLAHGIYTFELEILRNEVAPTSQNNQFLCVGFVDNPILFCVLERYLSGNPRDPFFTAPLSLSACLSLLPHNKYLSVLHAKKSNTQTHWKSKIISVSEIFMYEIQLKVDCLGKIQK